MCISTFFLCPAMLKIIQIGCDFEKLGVQSTATDPIHLRLRATEKSSYYCVWCIYDYIILLVITGENRVTIVFDRHLWLHYITGNYRRESLWIVIGVISGLTCTEQNFVTKAGAQRYAAEHGVAIVAPDTSPSELLNTPCLLYYWPVKVCRAAWCGHTSVALKICKSKIQNILAPSFFANSKYPPPLACWLGVTGGYICVEKRAI